MPKNVSQHLLLTEISVNLLDLRAFSLMSTTCALSQMCCPLFRVLHVQSFPTGVGRLKKSQMTVWSKCVVDLKKKCCSPTIIETRILWNAKCTIHISDPSLSCLEECH